VHDGWLIPGFQLSISATEVQHEHHGVTCK
jgi:hypothetical protein